MAKARKRRFNLRKAKTTAELPLATLATDTAVKVALVSAADGPYRCMSVTLTWVLKGLTSGEGPITVGLAHSDYTVAEIKEAIESAGAISLGSKIEQEQGNRLVREIGTFDSNLSSALNEGEPIKTRLNWRMNVGDTPVAFAYNNDDNSLTTGAILHVSGPIWVKDV